ncbi:PEP-CTERM sorting domain-containing protein [Leptothermofonsia sichuanensis E412]|uniref:PEP-CTERM sorting domain-containing protein n=1 Tax=Leptothermofonsia sichuanensis TaxID=2917832 RepID=UPI001CA6746F|nr:PEP-CTERM sorting domain-containing protein [Leptothermofonsia sichuanensis]QZZ19723.1 PEP-CTERM sorting domain-containing protein [Leptothermofonsia sichuanensis E412]
MDAENEWQKWMATSEPVKTLGAIAMKGMPCKPTTLSAVAAGITLLSSAGFVDPAQAFSVSISPSACSLSRCSTENTGAATLLDFTFTQSGNNVLLNLGISNTTNGSVGLGATQATLVGVAFDLISGVTLSAVNYNAGSSGFTKFWKDAALNPFGTFDVGISPNRQTFAGGNPQTGLTAGQTTLVSFLLTGSNLDAATVESSFLRGFSDGSLQVAARFQQVNAGGGSDKVLGGVIESGPSEAVPEPTTILGVAAAGTFLISRKKLQRQNAK